MTSIVVACTDLDGEVGFFTREAGFRVQLVTPADDPRRVVIQRDGLALELRRSDTDVPVRLRVEDDEARGGEGELRSPGGSVVEFGPRPTSVVLPESVPSLTVVDAATGGFGVGRAGMEYRDLLPDRWGGRFIASHIRIAAGGDVADWVHFHRVRFQMIFVAAGWVEVVYEDQGEPFRMVAGDCVLQPPEIRHRVLRSSPGLEVIEIGCPAEHDTLADHVLDLPTASVDRERDFGGQRFVRHVAENASRTTWVDGSLVVRDTGIGKATDGLAGAVVVAAGSEPAATTLTHEGEFVLLVGLAGDAVLDVGGRPVTFAPRTSIAIPAGTSWCWSAHAPDHEALVVSFPAGAVRGG
jgi:mannose-6-phosphate isomerase-like protein (cupin superfamily)